ncbi:hypothetical protein VNO80_20997 [Phaseolus coccineus]|uniref:Uncharacterized protein n=1 Tax=Phaseolus coccineus TaxID=3886 RepID=A0AAN9M726_PHACN
MCYRVLCQKCGKYTWGGCGDHLPSVYRNIGEGNHCMCRSWPGIVTPRPTHHHQQPTESTTTPPQGISTFDCWRYAGQIIKGLFGYGKSASVYAQGTLNFLKQSQWIV